MVRNRKTLIDYFEVDTSNGSIFTDMTWAPWWADIDPRMLSFEYFYNHSGLKLPSMLVRKWAGDGQISPSREFDLASIIQIKFQQKWSALWDLLQAVKESPDADSGEKKEVKYGKYVIRTGERDVDRNYRNDKAYAGSETHTLGGTDTFTNSSPEDGKRVVEHEISGSYADSDTRSLTKAGKEFVKDSNHVQTNVFGFNTASDSGVPSQIVDSPAASNQTETSFENRTDTNAGAVTRSYTNYKESDTTKGKLIDEAQYGKTDELSFSKDRVDSVDGEEDVYEDTKDTEINSGKDTVTTASHKKSFAELYSDTIEAFNSRNFFDVVFDDIDTVLTLRVWP